jgi:hypothetical protein
VKLALKHAPPSGLFKRLFHWITAARLVTRYPHAGIVIDDMLYHSNLSNGLHSERFLPAGWDLFEVADADGLALPRFVDLESTPYDIFGLLAFILPWNVSDSSRLYCYEWCWLAITGTQPRRRVTPEDLLALIASKK